MIRPFRQHSVATIAIVAALVASPAAAQDAAPVQNEDGTITTSQEIVVLGGIGYRNRSESGAEPVVSYDSEYFQRFEPLSAGNTTIYVTYKSKGLALLRPLRDFGGPVGNVVADAETPPADQPPESAPVDVNRWTFISKVTPSTHASKTPPAPSLTMPLTG